MDHTQLEAFIQTTRAALDALLRGSTPPAARGYLVSIRAALDALSAQQPAQALPLKVLVIDERDAQRVAAVDLLTRTGHAADGVSAGFRATGRLMRAVASGEPYQAVLIHVALKDSPAPELARAIQQEPRWQSPRVALLGGDHAATASLLALPDPLTADALRAWLHAQPAEPPVVLVADDSRVSQKLAEAMLRRLGYRPLVVDDGVKAVAQHGAPGVVAVLMDGQMPDMDGYGATAAIRALEARRGDGTRLPIIGMTADTFARPQALAAGMDDCLTKPVTFDDLSDALCRLLGPPPTPPLSGQPQASAPPRAPLEAEALRQLRLVSGDDSLLREVCEHLLADLPARQRALTAAITAHDWEEAARIAHALKSAARAVGATDLANLCATLERPNPPPPPPHATLTAALTDACHQTTTALRSLLGP
jgi:CheY-like chemotaxis protein